MSLTWTPHPKGLWARMSPQGADKTSLLWLMHTTPQASQRGADLPWGRRNAAWVSGDQEPRPQTHSKEASLLTGEQDPLPQAPQSPPPLPEAETLFLQNGNRSFPSPRKPPDPSSPREHVHPPARHTGKRDYSWSPSLSNVIDQWEPERNKFIHLGFLRRKTFSPNWSKFLYWLVHTFFWDFRCMRIVFLAMH